MHPLLLIAACCAGVIINEVAHWIQNMAHVSCYLKQVNKDKV